MSNSIKKLHVPNYGIVNDKCCGWKKRQRGRKLRCGQQKHRNRWRLQILTWGSHWRRITRGAIGALPLRCWSEVRRKAASLWNSRYAKFAWLTWVKGWGDVDGGDSGGMDISAAGGDRGRGTPDSSGKSWRSKMLNLFSSGMSGDWVVWGTSLQPFFREWATVHGCSESSGVDLTGALGLAPSWVQWWSDPEVRSIGAVVIAAAITLAAAAAAVAD